MKRTRALVALTLTLISTAALSTSAYGVVDSKAFLGSNCQPHDNPDFPFTKSFGRFTNKTSASQAVVCPAVGDSESVLGSQITGSVLLKHPSIATTECIMESFDSRGVRGGFTSQKVTFTGTRRIFFGKIGSGSSPASFQFVCVLGPKAELIQYATREE